MAESGYMGLQAAFDEGFDAVKAYIDRELTALELRIDDLESQLKSRGAVLDPFVVEAFRAGLSDGDGRHM